MTYALAALIAAFAYAAHLYRAGQQLSPDGEFYLAMASGAKVPRPYSYRPLLPLLLGYQRWRWQLTSALALIASGPLIVALVPGGLATKLTAVWLWCWLPGAFGVNVRLPVLVDSVAMALSLVSALLLLRGHYWAGMALLLITANIKESAPFFIAALALSWPAAVVGLATYLVKTAFLTSAAPEVEWLRHPFRAARESRDLLDWRPLLSWGALLPLALLGFGADRASLAALLSLALAYGQLLVAQDNARLFQWAAPALLPLAVRPELGVWALPVLTAHVFVANSWKGV